MKTDLHPQYYTATVTCSCGNTFTIGATVETMRVELCSNCHPFYTGDQKLVDTAGRVERFQERMSKVKKNEKSKTEKTEKTEQPDTNQDRLKALKKKLIQA